jgi:hypothetical protein
LSAIVIRFSYSWSRPAQLYGGLACYHKGFTMSSVTQYRCEMCGTESSNLMHWFMIRCNANLAYFHSGLTGIRDGTLLRASSILIELIPPSEQDPVSVWRFCGSL